MSFEVDGVGRVKEEGAGRGVFVAVDGVLVWAVAVREVDAGAFGVEVGLDGIEVLAVGVDFGMDAFSLFFSTMTADCDLTDPVLVGWGVAAVGDDLAIGCGIRLEPEVVRVLTDEVELGNFAPEGVGILLGVILVFVVATELGVSAAFFGAEFVLALGLSTLTSVPLALAGVVDVDGGDLADSSIA